MPFEKKPRYKQYNTKKNVCHHKEGFCPKEKPVCAIIIFLLLWRNLLGLLRFLDIKAKKGAHFCTRKKHRVEKEPFFGLDDKTWVVLPLLTLAYLCTYILHTSVDQLVRFLAEAPKIS